MIKATNKQTRSAENMAIFMQATLHWTAHRTYVSLTQILKDEKGVSEDLSAKI